MEKMSRQVWLIRGGFCNDGVIVCDRRNVAEDRAGWTGDGATVWAHDRSSAASGWLIHMWRGLQIDYGYLVRGCLLPDGTQTGFFHDRAAEPWTLLDGATWWSDRRMPAWLIEAGVVYPSDHRTQQRVMDDNAPISGTLGGIASFTLTGSGQNPIPEFWPQQPNQEKR
jgi:hypothetical protein